MAKRMWLTVACKTPGCNTTIPIKDHGPDIGAVSYEELAPTGFSYQCGRCKQTHRYEIEETRIQSLDLAPPPGWTNPF